MPQAHSSRVVLCVDSDRRAAEIRGAILRQAGYSVLLAYSDSRALEIVGSLAVDAVLLRYEMAQRNGIEIAVEMKRRNARLPIVLLGARISPPPGAEGVTDAFVHNIEAPDRWLRRLAALIDRGRFVVLNVDDSHAQRYAVTRMLQTSGFRVEEATTGAETLRAAARRPDLILLDINLPDISGFEVCRAIKRDPQTAAIPVLHLSATYTTAPYRNEGRKAGAAGYLTHPIGREELAAAVQAVIHASRSGPAPN